MGQMRFASYVTSRSPGDRRRARASSSVSASVFGRQAQCAHHPQGNATLRTLPLHVDKGHVRARLAARFGEGAALALGLLVQAVELAPRQHLAREVDALGARVLCAVGKYGVWTDGQRSPPPPSSVKRRIPPNGRCVTNGPWSWRS